MLRQFDIVQILTTKRIRFVSGPPGHATDPHGNWTVVGFIESDAMVAKDNTIARVPLGDLRQVASYNLDKTIQRINDAGYLKKDREINMPDHISKLLGIDIAKARELLLSYNYKTVVTSALERDKVTQRIAEIWQNRKNNKTREK